MRPGDWIEHLEMYDRRGIILGVTPEQISILLHGEREIQSIPQSEIGWWDPILTTGRVPEWIRERAHFRARSLHELCLAEVFQTRGEFVAYTLLDMGTFHIRPWAVFIQRWAPIEPPTAWYRLQEDSFLE